MNLRNWGHDFPHAKKLMSHIGINIEGDALLEFPTSTMFWARREALEPLFKLGLQYEDFEEELGQIDGTLAHAIERCILLVAETKGYRSLKVVAESEVKESESFFMRLSVHDIKYMLKRKAPRLLGSFGVTSRFYSSVAEVYPVNVASSDMENVRLNIMLPTMKPEKIYGGITTAISVAKNLIRELPDNIDIRVLITSDTVDKASIDELAKRLGRNFTLVAPNEDLSGATMVDLAERRHLPVSLRTKDIFFATAWWTADLAFRLREAQVEVYGGARPILYLIQDFEPGFYPWSNHYALSEATYSHSDSTIALINSEELASYMDKRYAFKQVYCIPYSLHKGIACNLRPTVKEKIILVYGRPTVARNCFDLILEGIRIWQSENPKENTSYKILFAGETFSQRLISELENAKVLGKLSIDEYSELLNRAAIGISMMVSPHPSYPPLEMASAGCVTITNRYESKDLNVRSENFHSIDALTPKSIADSLNVAINRVKYSVPTPLEVLAAPETNVASVDYELLASELVYGNSQ